MLIVVIRMQRVSIHLEVLGVCVTLGSLEMDLHAQVINITCSKTSSPPSFPLCKYEGGRLLKFCHVLVMSCKIRPMDGTHSNL